MLSGPTDRTVSTQKNSGRPCYTDAMHELWLHNRLALGTPWAPIWQTVGHVAAATLATGGGRAVFDGARPAAVAIHMNLPPFDRCGPSRGCTSNPASFGPRPQPPPNPHAFRAFPGEPIDCLAPVRHRCSRRGGHKEVGQVPLHSPSPRPRLTAPKRLRCSLSLSRSFASPASGVVSIPGAPAAASDGQRRLFTTRHTMPARSLANESEDYTSEEEEMEQEDEDEELPASSDRVRHDGGRGKHRRRQSGSGRGSKSSWQTHEDELLSR